jgi:hypothetical protein
MITGQKQIDIFHTNIFTEKLYFEPKMARSNDQQRRKIKPIQGKNCVEQNVDECEGWGWGGDWWSAVIKEHTSL